MYSYHPVLWLGNSVPVHLNAHDDSFTHLAIPSSIIICISSIVLVLVRCEIAVAENTLLFRQGIIVSIVAEEIIASLVGQIHGILGVRHGDSIFARILTELRKW
jgi:hypothetical protein